MIVIK